jgi:hypothetical protein
MFFLNGCDIRRFWWTDDLLTSAGLVDDLKAQTFAAVQQFHIGMTIAVPARP